MLKLFKWIYKLGYDKGYKDGELCGVSEYKLELKKRRFERKFGGTLNQN